jgi:hypothetical protein
MDVDAEELAQRHHEVMSIIDKHIDSCQQTREILRQYLPDFDTTDLCEVESRALECKRDFQSYLEKDTL